MYLCACVGHAAEPLISEIKEAQRNMYEAIERNSREVKRDMLELLGRVRQLSARIDQLSIAFAPQRARINPINTSPTRIKNSI